MSAPPLLPVLNAEPDSAGDKGCRLEWASFDDDVAFVLEDAIDQSMVSVASMTALTVKTRLIGSAAGQSLRDRGFRKRARPASS